MSSFKMTTTALLVTIVPLSCSFLWIAPSIAEADGIVTSGAGTFLAKRTPNFISGPDNLPNKIPRNPPD